MGDPTEQEVKVTEAPEPEEKVEAPADEPLIDNRRAEVEKLVTASHLEISEGETSPKKAEEKKEEKPEELDPIEKIKKSVQKRIDKVVAQKKSVEEELAEAKAELARLKSFESKTPEKSDAPPTVEQVEAYIIKMREEGNTKEEVAAMRYLIKLEKDQALKEVREEQTKAQKAEEEAKARQLQDWTALQNDYVDYTSEGKPNPKSDLTLANQNGLLYKTALSLYNDKELHADYYNDPDIIQGFRRAVADAYREIHQQGLVQSPKGEALKQSLRISRDVLAEPGTELSDETPEAGTLKPLSDADKVREEIEARRKNRYVRKPS